MSLFDSLFSRLTGSVGQNLQNNPNDINMAERALKRTGYFNSNLSKWFITAELDKGIRTFQRDNNLKTDGIMHPNGETEQALFKKIKMAQNGNNSDYRMSDLNSNAQSQIKNIGLPMPERKPDRYSSQIPTQDFPKLDIYEIPAAKKDYYKDQTHYKALKNGKMLYRSIRN